MRRAVWQDDESAPNCTRCHVQFGLTVFKHHCRRCGQIFCDDCSKNKLLIPQDELVPRPASWIQQKMPDLVNDEDNFRIPQRVCEPCSHVLRMNQGELRQNFSMYNQETNVDFSNNMPSLPGLDFRLEQEIQKATVMLYNFRNTQGEEKIPKELLDISKGVVFLTIVKVGFVFTGRYGTGLVITKLDDGTWSAPSAVTISGMGWGFQVGAEITDVMLILTSDAAVDTFKSRAQISVGAELGVSVGPIGRSIGSDVTAGSTGAAHAFSYAHSKGLFFGASLEASGIAARPDVNRMFYGEKVSTTSLLSGEYPKPKGAEPLYKALDETLGRSAPKNSNLNRTNSNNPYGGGGLSARLSSSTTSTTSGASSAPAPVTSDPSSGSDSRKVYSTSDQFANRSDNFALPDDSTYSL